jgi:SAM-dependent methyltransferase
MNTTTTDKYAQTLAYYDDGALKYFERTLAVDMAGARERLTWRLRAGSHILDAGCGSGRDSKAFLDAGFKVTAFDASAPLAALASSYIGQPVQVLRFQDVTWTECFDGIFACASLLHLDDKDLAGALHRLVRSLRPRGEFVALFKHGTGIRWDADTARLFNDMNDARAKEFLSAAGLSHIETNLDVDKLGRGNDWLTVMGRRAPDTGYCPI